MAGPNTRIRKCENSLSGSHRCWRHGRCPGAKFDSGDHEQRSRAGVWGADRPVQCTVVGGDSAIRKLRSARSERIRQKS